MKLSIIIPYYKTLNETIKLLKTLEKQITNNVEVIIIDDGCNETELDLVHGREYIQKGKYGQSELIYNGFFIVHAKENEGLSEARNLGLELACGEYVTFIDSDDNISDDYIETILHKIYETDFDCCYFGWKAMNTNLTVYIDDKPPLWNWAVWNAVYKRDLIEPFEGRKFEDVPWQKKMRPKFKKIEHIHKILYYYNNGREGSITDLHSKGLN